jgi:hypothetical protein
MNTESLLQSLKVIAEQGNKSRYQLLAEYYPQELARIANKDIETFNKLSIEHQTGVTVDLPEYSEELKRILLAAEAMNNPEKLKADLNRFNKIVSKGFDFDF